MFGRSMQIRGELTFLAGNAELSSRQTAREPVELAIRNDVSALSEVNTAIQGPLVTRVTGSALLLLT